LSACDNSTALPPPEEPKRFVYVSPPPPKATHVPEGMSQWLGLLGELRQQISELEARLQDASKVHRETSFDELLKVDLSTLGNDQLAYLWHFADKGYFTLEREVKLKLLEDQQTRPATTLNAPSNIAERAQVLAARYEDHLQDLQLAVELYAKTKDVEFHIPNQLDAEQADILKGMVTEKLARASEECATLDQRIEQLQQSPRSGRN
jgi:hypothetical protein